MVLLIPLGLGCWLSNAIAQESALRGGRVRIVGAVIIAAIHGVLLFVGYYFAFVGFETDSGSGRYIRFPISGWITMVLGVLAGIVFSGMAIFQSKEEVLKDRFEDKVKSLRERIGPDRARPPLISRLGLEVFD